MLHSINSALLAEFRTRKAVCLSMNSRNAGRKEVAAGTRRGSVESADIRSRMDSCNRKNPTVFQN